MRKSIRNIPGETALQCLAEHAQTLTKMPYATEDMLLIAQLQNSAIEIERAVLN
jgi:hypothetical protein